MGFMDALENQPVKFLKRGHSIGDNRLEDSQTDSPEKKRQTNAADDLIKSIGTTNAEVEKFLNENGHNTRRGYETSLEDDDKLN